MNGSCLLCEIANCSMCSANNQCSQCVANYSLSDNSCFLCNDPNCMACSADNVCSMCMGNLTLGNGSCFTCDVPNCMTCASLGVCQACASGFNLLVSNGTTSCVVPCPDNCSSCNQTTGACSECQTGFTLDTANNTCFSCNVSNCMMCNGTDICMTCYPIFNLASNVCTCPNTTVIAIGGSTPTCVCSNANETFSNTTGQCEVCALDHCMTCNGSVCAVCMTGYNNVNGSCETDRCPIADCNACSFSSFCTACQSNANNLALTPDHQSCVSCSANCLYCNANGTCNSCVTGYTVNTNGTCTQCDIDNCLLCETTNVCTSCDLIFSPNDVGSACIPCEEPCATCNSNKTCKTCAYGYSSTPTAEGVCYICASSLCLSCNYPDVSTCTSCMPGYELDNGMCKAPCAQSMCQQCLSSNSSHCEQCAEGYYVDASTATCMQCFGYPYCVQCEATSSTVCTICRSDHYLGINSRCIPCPIFCATCNATACLTVRAPSGYTVYSPNGNGTTTLAACDTECMTCSPNYPSNCIECRHGYYMVTLSSQGGSINYCASCADSCMTCVGPSNG